ncbi:MAG: 2-dehydro-3-deoxy-D-gluconate 5-dehydrogenase KduD [Paenibacillaceae bacterium]
MHMFNLTGKNALVTGGASGLGQAAAIGLAEAGANVIIVTNQNKGVETQAAIRALGRKVIAISADLSDEASLPELINQANTQMGEIDILVNNAGIIRRKPAAEHSAQDWHDVIQVNVNSVFFLSQLVGRGMLERGSGKIINIASMLTFQGGINVPGYTTSKHAIAGITKALASEWASKGLNINAIAPGYMATANTKPLREDPMRSKQILDRIPAGRWGTPEDLKGPVVFLASEASNYMNGHIMCVDGGWMVR